MKVGYVARSRHSVPARISPDADHSDDAVDLPQDGEDPQPITPGMAEFRRAGRPLRRPGFNE